MIVCSCSVITDTDIEEALIEIMSQPDAPLPTPGVVYQHLSQEDGVLRLRAAGGQHHLREDRSAGRARRHLPLRRRVRAGSPAQGRPAAGAPADRATPDPAAPHGAAGAQSAKPELETA